MKHKHLQANWKNALRLGLMAAGTLILLSAILLSSTPPSASAAPDDLNRAVSKYPNLAGSVLQQCTLCHLGYPPMLNAYGAAYKSAGRSLAAFAAIENKDSDNDGFTNLQELNALTFPGDAASVPASTPVPPTPTSIPPTPTQLPPPGVTPTPPPTSIPPTPSGQVSVHLACPASVMIGTSFTCTLSVNPAGTPLSGLQINFSGLNGLVEYTGAQFTPLAGVSPVSLSNTPGIFTWAGANGYTLTQPGDLAILSFRSLAAGSTNVGGQTKAANAVNAPVNVSLSGAQVTIIKADGEDEGKVKGRASLAAGVSPTRASAALLNASGQIVVSTGLKSDGSYELKAPAGVYTLSISAPGYLAAKKPVTLLEDKEQEIATISLFAGDINGDGSIGPLDLISLGAAFEIIPPFSAADLNADGKVDLFDLTMLAQNWRKTGYTGW